MKPTCTLLLATALLGTVTVPGSARAQAPEARARNPVIWADVPDPSVVRVDSVYYMTSTTMHMNPGVPIMRSTNLVDWQTVGYAYDQLGSDAMSMRNHNEAYGRGTWASSIRYHEGMFYIATFSYTTGESYVFTATNVEKGPWRRASLGGLYHDQSLFFDDDGRTYLVYGAGDIRIIELTADARAVKAGGVDRVLIRNAGAPAGTSFNVPGEGSHMLKRDGKYYLSLIAWPRGGMRTQVVYRADRLDGPWEGRVVLADEGIAQGGLVDTPDGRWYALLFGDRGAVGRIPYLVPVTWSDGWPVHGVNGKVPATLDISSNGTGVRGIVASDEFDGERLGLAWQWNHNPANQLWSLQKRPGHLRLTTGRLDDGFLQARNTLTQRTFGPQSGATTALDVSGMKDGDVAGLGLLAEHYGFVGVRKENGATSLVMASADSGEVARVPFDGAVVHLRADADFRERADRAVFSYSLDGATWTPIGHALRMRYTLVHFMGYRFALFNFATKTPGGWADFDYLHLGGTGLNGATDLPAQNRLAPADEQTGWKLLFDGRTFDGWRGLGLDSVPSAHWMVQDGTIRKVPSGQVPVQADGQPVAGGDLMTVGTYRDFEFAFEWKVTAGANSGVKYNVSEALSRSVPPDHAAKAFEYQVLDDDLHPDGKQPNHRAGALYDLVAPNQEKQLRPVGEWNEARIVLRGNHGEHWLNGRKVVEYELGTPAMDSALARSKYRPMSWFADRRAGHIVLQDHTDEVWFRNLRIRELGAAPR